jgi:hypothetical protein
MYLRVVITFIGTVSGYPARFRQITPIANLKQMCYLICSMPNIVGKTQKPFLIHILINYNQVHRQPKILSIHIAKGSIGNR